MLRVLGRLLWNCIRYRAGLGNVVEKAKPRKKIKREARRFFILSISRRDLFDFGKQFFIYSIEKESFCKLPYPTKEAFGYYLKRTGHGTEAQLLQPLINGGRNVWVKLSGTNLLPGGVSPLAALLVKLERVSLYQ